MVRPANTGDRATAPKLTPEQQRGLRLLRSAEAETSALQPDMRTFVLMLIADGYRKIDRRKSHALLKEAFAASLSIEDIAPQGDDGEHFCPQMQGCGIKAWLQREILLSLGSPTEVQGLLSAAQPEVQRQVMESLIFRYSETRDFEKAKELIKSLASDGDYPYDAAMHLMLLLPPTTMSERVAIFEQALQNYAQQGESNSYGGAFDGMAGMVMRFWHDVPPAMAIDAIDQILEKAKDVSAGPDNVRLTFSGDAGTVSLSSQYQYRLFQLLPVLQNLDKAQAESLLRENPDVQALLDRFPAGLEAVQPDYELHPPKKGQTPISSSTVSLADSPPTAINALAIQAQQEIRGKEGNIVAEAEIDPKKALADSMSLPAVAPFPDLYGEDDSPRARTLLRIAKNVDKKNKEVTRDALGEVRRSLTRMPPVAHAQILDDVAEEYLNIDDEDDADSTIKEALEAGDTLYVRDSDIGDPNQIFKGAWPSTNQWRRCIQIAARYAPSTAEAIIAGIRDPEIAAFEKVYFANSLVGVPTRTMDVGESHKNGQRFAPF